MPSRPSRREVLRSLVALYRHLSSLAIQNAGLDTMAALIAERVQTAVAVVDEQLAVLAAVDAHGSAPGTASAFFECVAGPRLARVLDVVGPTRRPLRFPGVDGTPPIIVAPRTGR